MDDKKYTYRVSACNVVQKYRKLRETNKSVWFAAGSSDRDGETRVIREPKISYGSKHFDSFEAAKEHALRRLHSKLKQYKMFAKNTEADIIAVEELTESDL